MWNACVRALPGQRAALVYSSARGVSPLAAVAAELSRPSYEISARLYHATKQSEKQTIVHELGALYKATGRNAFVDITSLANFIRRVKNVDEMADTIRVMLDVEHSLPCEAVVAAFERLASLEHPNVVFHPVYVHAIRPRISQSMRRTSFKPDSASYERILRSFAAIGEDDTMLHNAAARGFLWTTRTVSQLERVPMRLLLLCVAHGVRATVEGARLRAALGVAQTMPAVDMDAVASQLCALAGPALDRRRSVSLLVSQSRFQAPIIWCRTSDGARAFRRIVLAVQHRMWTMIHSNTMKVLRFAELSSLVVSATAVIESEFAAEAHALVGASERSGGRSETALQDGTEWAKDAANESVDSESVELEPCTVPLRALPTVAMSARLLHLSHAYLAAALPRDVNLREFWLQKPTANSAMSSSSSSGSESESGEAYGGGNTKKVPSESVKGTHTPGFNHGSSNALAAHFADALPNLLHGITVISRFDLGEVGSAQVDPTAGVQTRALQEGGGMGAALDAYNVLMLKTADFYDGVSAVAHHVRKHWHASQDEIASVHVTPSGLPLSAHTKRSGVHLLTESASSPRPSMDDVITVSHRMKAGRGFPLDPYAVSAVGAPAGPETHPKYRVMFRSLEASARVAGSLAHAARALGLVTWDRWRRAEVTSQTLTGAYPVSSLSTEAASLVTERTYGALERVLSAHAGSHSTRSPDLPAVAAVLTVLNAPLSDVSSWMASLTSAYSVLEALNVQLGFITEKSIVEAEHGVLLEGWRPSSRAERGKSVLFLRKTPQVFHDLAVAAMAHYVPQEMWPGGNDTQIQSVPTGPARSGASGALDPCEQSLRAQFGHDMATLLHAALSAGVRADATVPLIKDLSPRDAGTVLEMRGTAAYRDLGLRNAPFGVLGVRAILSSVQSSEGNMYVRHVENMAAMCITHLLRDAYQGFYMPADGDIAAAARTCRVETALECALMLENIASGDDRTDEEHFKTLYYATRVCSFLVRDPASSLSLGPGVSHRIPLFAFLLRLATKSVHGLAESARALPAIQADGAAAATLRLTQPDVVSLLHAVSALPPTHAQAEGRGVSESARALEQVWAQLVEVAGGLTRASNMQTVLQEVEDAVLRLGARVQ